MPLYTFIMDFDCGTYLSQVSAPDAKSDARVWAARLKPGVVGGMGKALLGKLRSDLASDEPVPVSGLGRVWCLSALLRGRLAIIHFVQTSPMSESDRQLQAADDRSLVESELDPAGANI